MAAFMNRRGDLVQTIQWKSKQKPSIWSTKLDLAWLSIYYIFIQPCIINVPLRLEDPWRSKRFVQSRTTDRPCLGSDARRTQPKVFDLRKKMEVVIFMCVTIWKYSTINIKWKIIAYVTLIFIYTCLYSNLRLKCLTYIVSLLWPNSGHPLDHLDRCRVLWRPAPGKQSFRLGVGMWHFSLLMVAINQVEHFSDFMSSPYLFIHDAAWWHKVSSQLSPSKGYTEWKLSRAWFHTFRHLYSGLRLHNRTVLGFRAYFSVKKKNHPGSNLRVVSPSFMFFSWWFSACFFFNPNLWWHRRITCYHPHLGWWYCTMWLLRLDVKHKLHTCFFSPEIECSGKAGFCRDVSIFGKGLNHDSTI